MSRRLLSLAPITNLDSNQPSYAAYSDRLNAVYRDNELRNIALIGKRGSGKSSILRTYDRMRHNGEEKFLYISLIEFEKKHDPKTTEQIQKRLEYSLLCQILARCTESDLQKSSFTGIPPVNSHKFPRILAFIYCFVTMLLIYGLVFHARFGDVLQVFNFPPVLIPLVHAAGYVLAFLLVFCGAWYMFRKNSAKFHIGNIGFKFGGLETQINPSEHFCLDHYKFEIIHILNKLSKRIGYTIVFEDMERLEPEVCIDIMTKLREINTLLNTHRKTTTWSFRSALINWLLQSSSLVMAAQSILSEVLGESLPGIATEETETIRFIYAMSDEVLDSDSRSKFFDTIIPVIPALNTSNASDTLSYLLKKCGIPVGSHRMEHLLEIITPELTDFRTLRNTISEATLLMDIVEREAGSDALTPETSSGLLALSVYKCLFPKEYTASLSTIPFKICQPEQESRDSGKDNIDNIDNMLTTLIQEKYLDESYFKMVGFSTKQLQYQQIQILKTGTPSEKLELVKSTKAGDIPWLRETIVKGGYLLDAESEDTILAFQMLYKSPVSCIHDLQSLYLRNTPLALLRLLAAEICHHHFTNNKSRSMLSSIMRISVVNGNTHRTYAMLMHALSQFSEDKISNAAKEIGQEELVASFSKWLSHYSFNIFSPSFWLHFQSIEIADEIDDLFSQTILPCLGSHMHKLPKSIQRKRIGIKRISKLIEEYDQTHPRDPVNVP